MSKHRLWIAAVIGAVALGLVLVFVLRGGGGASAVPQQPVEGATALSRSGTLFADPLRAFVQVVVDRRRVDPSRVGFTTHFEPFVRIGIPHVSRHDSGRLTRLVYTAKLNCLTNVCLSNGDPAPVHVRFPPAEVFYTPKTGGRSILRLPWQALTMGPRTTLDDLAGGDPILQPSWRATTDPVPVSYGISPRTLRTLLFAGSGVLFALALLALVRFVRTGRLRLRVLSRLERAVLLVERTPDQAPERRKALELLSDELVRSGEPALALVAKELAWAEPTPLPTLTQPLTLDVRRLIGQRSNGHAA